jgi:hypothetical protein
MAKGNNEDVSVEYNSHRCIPSFCWFKVVCLNESKKATEANKMRRRAFAFALPFFCHNLVEKMLRGTTLWGPGYFSR